ncbi:MAG: glycosyltransferase family 4 protein [Pirellulaceae bacterium]|nr:glycosyltransferase family 4 protein [Pirellulaceae bacterium]
MPATQRRITLLIHSLAGGGAERQIASLSNHLSQRGFRCTLITLDSAKSDRYPLDPDVNRVGLDVMKPSRSLFAACSKNRMRIKVLRDAIKRSQPDCAISFCDKMNILALAACQTLSVPTIISERSDPRKQHLGWIWEAARRWHYPNSTAVVAQTEPVAAYLRTIVGSNVSIEVIPTAIDIPSQGLDNRTDSLDRNTIIYIGRLSKEKGPDRLLQAWSTVASKHPSWQLRIVGVGPMDSQLKNQCNDLSIAHRVDWVGWSDNIWSHLRQSRAFVLPSHYEGFPAALVEAMHAGLPVIATDCSDSIREIIQHEQNGLIASNNRESLANAIDRLLADASLRKSLGASASASTSKYLWPSTIERWIQLVDRVIKLA